MARVIALLPFSVFTYHYKFYFHLPQTGWVDIGLTKQGRDQAIAAGRAVQFTVSKGILPSKDMEICDSDGTIRKKQVPAIDVAFCLLLK